MKLNPRIDSKALCRNEVRVVSAIPQIVTHYTEMCKGFKRLNHSIKDGMMETFFDVQKKADKATMDALRGIYYLLKSYQVQSAEDLLNTFDCGRLTCAGLRVYHRFLWIKVALFYFQTNNDFDALKKAEMEMNVLLEIAASAKIRLKDPNYLYTQAFIQLKIAEFGETIEIRIPARKLAQKLVNRGIHHYHMDCFYWLEAQLQDTI